MHALPRWIHTPIDRPTLTLCLFLFFCVVTSIGTANLYFRGDYKVFFKDDNPQRVAYQEMQDTFNKSDNVSFVVVPIGSNIYEQKTLNLIEFLTEQAWQLPFSVRVESLSNYQHTYADDDELIVESLYDESDITD